MPAPEGDQTGGARFRTSWTGKLILQVEYEERRDQAMDGPVRGWRDATERDLYRMRYMRRQHQLEPLL